MKRRLLLATSALLPAVMLAGCDVFSSSSSGGVTTVSVKTATAVAYISGFAALVSTILGVPGVSAAFGAAAIGDIEAAVADVNAVVPAINSAAGDSTTLTFNVNSVPAFVESLESDASSILSSVEAGIAGMGATVPTTVETYYNGLVSVGNAIAALFSVSSAASARLAATTPLVSVADALALVHIQAP